MTLQVQILIPAGQVYQGRIVAVDTNPQTGDRTESVVVDKAAAGVIHTTFVTSTRHLEVREILPGDPALEG